MLDRMKFPLTVVGMVSVVLTYVEYAGRPTGAPPVAQRIVAAQTRTTPMTLDQLCKAEAPRVRTLLDALDLKRPGLRDVAAAAARDDLPAACEALLSYFRHRSSAGRDTSNPTPVARPAAVPAATIREADAILHNTLTIQGVTGTIPRLPNGHLNWSYGGPNNDLEFGYFINRCLWLSPLNQAWRGTGDAKYPAQAAAMLDDWIAANPVPSKRVENVIWRALELGGRIGMWSGQFLSFVDAPGFDDTTRIRMLASLVEQTRYLIACPGPGGSNHTLMEMSGLAALTRNFPEFKEQSAWLDHAQSVMLDEAKTEVYPDGAQYELTSHYHKVSVRQFENVGDDLKKAGRPVPPEFRTVIESMYNYLALIVDSRCHAPANNDSDDSDSRKMLLEAADRYDRADWRYVATNGAKGTRPADPPSRFFPYAGQVAMRDGWGGQDDYAFFDAGPWGAGHQHNDRMNLTMTVHGRPVLVDSGRYTYTSNEWRHYFVMSAAHNLVLVDGMGQNETVKTVTAPLPDLACDIRPDYDFAIATYGDGFADRHPRYFPDSVKNPVIPAKHTRAVIYVRGRYWVVIDRVESDKPRTLTALWHFHPDCTVGVDGQDVRTTDPGVGNLRITPVSAWPWKTTIVAGQTKPTIQGWFSDSQNVKRPAPCATYSAVTPTATADFAWLLLPGGPNAAPAAVTAQLLPSPAGTAHVVVHEKGRADADLTVRFAQRSATVKGLSGAKN